MIDTRDRTNNSFKDAGKHFCTVCGVQFFAYRKTRKYCSSVCYGRSPEMRERLKVMSAIPRTKKAGPKPKPKVPNKICTQCGVAYWVRPSNFALSNYCGRKCKHLGMKSPPKPCSVCGALHTRHRKTCSQECSAKWASLKQAGEKSHRWEGGKTSAAMKVRNSKEYAQWRTAVYERDGYACQHCGQRGGKLHADHIKPFSTHPELRFDLSNGRTLCIDCHRKTDTWGFGAVHSHQRREKGRFVATS